MSLMLICLSLASAQTFSATGGVRWDVGMDIDHNTSGFEVVVKDLRFDAALGDPTTVEKTGEKFPYSQISINGLRISTDNDASHSSEYITPNPSSINASTDWGSRNLTLRWNQLSAKMVFSDFFNVVLWYNNYNAYYHAVTFTTYNGDGYGIANAYAYSIYSGLYGGTDVSSSLYNSWEVSGDDSVPTNKVFFKASNYSWKAPTSNAFITANFSIPAIADFTAQVGSYKSYQDNTRFVYDGGEVATTVGNHGYSGIFTVKLTAIENLNVVAAVAGDVGTPDIVYSPLAFGGKAEYTFAVADDIAITPALYFDGQLPDIDTYSGAPTPVKSTDKFDCAFAGGLKFDAFGSVATVNVGYGINGAYVSTTDRSDATKQSLRGTAAVAFSSIENLTIKAAVEYVDDNLDADNDDTFGYHGFVSYDLLLGDAIVTPFAEFSSTNLNHVADYDFFAKAGVTFSGFMKNTTFKLFWDSNDLTGEYTPYSMDDRYGRIVFRTDIKF